MEPTREAVLDALSGVIDPELRKPVTELDMVRDVEIDGGHVSITIALTVAGCPLRSSFEQQVQERLAGVAGVEAVRLGVNEYLLKPVSSSALLARLVSIVTKPRRMVKNGDYYGPEPRTISSYKPDPDAGLGSQIILIS